MAEPSSWSKRVSDLTEPPNDDRVDDLFDFSDEEIAAIIGFARKNSKTGAPDHGEVAGGEHDH